MSHELRTPLNSIIGLTKILIDEGNFTQDENDDLPPMMVPVIELVSGHGLGCPFKKGWSEA